MATTGERERSDQEGSDTHAAPETPAQLDKRSWLNGMRRTGREFKDDNLTDWAAALTYYGILSIFPALMALVSLLGLVGQSATQPSDRQHRRRRARAGQADHH